MYLRRFNTSNILDFLPVVELYFVAHLPLFCLLLFLTPIINLCRRELLCHATARDLLELTAADRNVVSPSSPLTLLYNKIKFDVIIGSSLFLKPDL